MTYLSGHFFQRFLKGQSGIGLHPEQQQIFNLQSSAFIIIRICESNEHGKLMSHILDTFPLFFVHTPPHAYQLSTREVEIKWEKSNGGRGLERDDRLFKNTKVPVNTSNLLWNFFQLHKVAREMKRQFLAIHNISRYLIWRELYGCCIITLMSNW